MLLSDPIPQVHGTGKPTLTDRSATSTSLLSLDEEELASQGRSASAWTLPRCDSVADLPALAALIAEGLRSNAPETVAPRTKALRARFQGLHFITA